MHFDFYEQYKDYPDTELQKITRQPDSYQPEAVDAALKLLKERGVKDSSIHLLDSFEITEEIKIPKLLFFFLVLLALEYLWQLYSTLNVFFEDGSVGTSYMIPVALIPFAFRGFIFYLLLKRKVWGWILLFFTSATAAGTGLLQLSAFFKYAELNNVRDITFIAIAFFNLFLAIYLWQKEALTYFKVTNGTKLWTTLVVVCVLTIIVLYRS